MRRGHPGAGGWRGDNQRHYRPRGSGTQHFRPSRSFGQMDAATRYPPPGPRPFRGTRQFGQPPGRPDNIPPLELHDRNKYRINNVPRPSQDRGYHNRSRQMPPFQMRKNQHDSEHGGSHSESNFYQNQEQCHVNNMGDIDHRRQHQISPWAGPPPYENTRQYYDGHKSPHKTPRHLNMGDDLPDYSGHRPPASDHYTTTTVPNNNNSQYTRSVDDTVDIIRKRLLNRDKQQESDPSIDLQCNMDEDLRKNTAESYQNLPQEQPVKKRIQKQKQNIKSNCDKMKNKIVHQLFKMDKVKIHKLMDNPNSSNKFEYAISSLITEGQNILNRHLRSVAEKSLCSKSTDFIQDDNNTIYEDTFMKQMQGVLDPQDTVFLEDIKPIVMAELSRVLQLDDFQLETMQDYGVHNQDIQDHRVYDQKLEDPEIQNQRYVINDSGKPKDEPTNYQYYDEVPITEQYPGDMYYDEDHRTDNNEHNIEITTRDIDEREVITGDMDERNFDFENSRFESKPLFERRPSRRADCIGDSRHSRKSIDKSFGYLYDKPVRDSPSDCTPSIPLFDPNADQLSEDDDPFAEFDKQYHVAVDRNFIENENASRPSSPQQTYINNSDKSPSFSRPTKIIEAPNVNTDSVEIQNAIDVQLHDIVEHPVKFFPSSSKNETESNSKTNIDIKHEAAPCLEKENLISPSCEQVEKHLTDAVINETSSNKRQNKKEPETFVIAENTKFVLQSNTRKRSTDQKPSHRKEKRKRSSHSECLEAAKSIINMFYTNDDIRGTPKSSKKCDSTDKVYSDKYVKRKESYKKSKVKESDESKKHNSSNHSNISPKDNLSNETPAKSDSKAKLKPIDIFGEVIKKGSVHQAHKNTAQSPDDIKPKIVTPTSVSFARKLSKKHIGTQVVLKVRNKDCQTDKLKRHDRKIQTDPVSMNISKNTTSNPLERMKEIDMEIQLLLQEKFKLYNSLETKAITVPMDSMPSLSMRVFKVNTDQVEEKLNELEDAIVDDFTSIPAEELEQIALETVKVEENPVKSDNKHAQKAKAVQEPQLTTLLKSESPTLKKSKKKLNSPNISIIEQIITDDRPIEDIICLDDFENTPVKSKKKQRKAVPKKKSSKKSKLSKAVVHSIPYKTQVKSYDIKECSVVLQRINISDYLKPKTEAPLINSRIKFEEPIIELSPVVDSSFQVTEIPNEEIHMHNGTPESSLLQVVEDVVNDLQFDMLDVSEDIIIGDNCEVKADDKINEREVITEDIILDNSQSSIEDTPVITGAENECKTYDYSTNETLRRDAITVVGNADAVLAIECIENDFIAACLDGNVYHFSGDGQLLKTFRGTNQAVTCLTIVQEKYGTTIYTGSLDSRIRYYDLESGVEKGPECNVLSPIQTMDRAWDTIFVGTRTGFVLQFECKNNMLIPVSTVKFSEQSILALRAMKEGARKVLLVAARSENVVTIKDAQTGLLLRTLQGPKMSVYTLLFEDGKVYCGTSSHNIHVFDYSSGAHVMSHEGGKGAVCLLAAGGLVFAGCYDGCVYVFREGEPRPRAQLRGPSLMLLSLAVRNTKIIAGYKDRGLYIWKLPLAIVQEMIL